MNSEYNLVDNSTHSDISSLTVSNITVTVPNHNVNDDVIRSCRTTSDFRLKTWTAIKEINIEVCMFLFLFSTTVKNITTTNLIIEKICVHQHPEDLCANLSSISVDVERLSTNYNLGRLLIGHVPSALLACFVGAWSDKHGRRSPLLVALCGLTLESMGELLCSVFMDCSADYILLSAAFRGFSGGVVSVYTVLYSCVSDTTTSLRRSWKFTTLMIVAGVTKPLAQLAGGWIYESCGFTSVYIASISSLGLAILWVLCLLPETKTAVRESWTTKCGSFWSTRSLKASFEVTFKSRPNKGRRQILLLAFALSLSILSTTTSESLGFLYAHILYGWDNVTYSTVSAITLTMGMLMMPTVILSFRRFRLNDSVIGFVGSLSLLAKSLGMAVAFRKEIYFAASFAGLLEGLVPLAGRTRTSKIVASSETGKIFSFLSTVDVLLPIAATFLVSQVFNATIDEYPGIIYILLSVVFTIPVGIYAWIIHLPAFDYEEHGEVI